MEDFNLHLTGDVHAIGAAHNLAAAFIDNHVHHGNALGIDAHGILWPRVVDISDRALREIVVGLGGKENGYPRETQFVITVASEVMAILALADDVRDLRARLGRVVVAQTQELWANLADRRRLLREVAPLPDRKPDTVALAHLPRPDPFRVFAGYTTAMLQPDCVVSLIPGTTPEAIEARLKSPLSDFATQILPELAEMQAAFRHLAASGGGLKAGELAELVAPGRSARLYRGLVWMAKTDLVRIAPPVASSKATG